jgi:hypothetical protein
MNEPPLIGAILNRLRLANYQELQTPFRVAGVPFQFTAALRGQAGRSHDLVLLVDTTTGDAGDRNAERVRQRVESLSRALDITRSRLVITVILAGAPLLGDIEGLSATCRVLFVEGLSIDASGEPVDEYAKNLLEDRIRLLLPLDLPEPIALEGGGGVAVVQLIHKLSGAVDQGLLHALIEASNNGEDAVTAAAAAVLDKLLTAKEQP